MINLNYLNVILFLIISFIVMKITFIILYKFNVKDLDTSLKLTKSTNTVTSLGVSFLLIFFLNLSYLYFTLDFKDLLPNRFYIFFISIFFLTLISFRDDIKEIDPKVRLIFQLVFIYFSLTNIELQNLNLPLKLMIFFALIVWVYIINITNFIDGSDGHCSLHVLFFMLGIMLTSYLQNEIYFSTILAFITIPILIIFIVFFNKPKAKSYMGDTGSIFLGYIVGYIILENIFLQKNFYIFALFLYPILDCTITLIQKTIKGYYPWAKLGDYFFLIPIKNGNNHIKVFYFTIFYNIANLSLYFVQNYYSRLFLICNIILSISLIFYYRSFKNEK